MRVSNKSLLSHSATDHGTVFCRLLMHTTTSLLNSQERKSKNPQLIEIDESQVPIFKVRYYPGEGDLEIHTRPRNYDELVSIPLYEVTVDSTVYKGEDIDLKDLFIENILKLYDRIRVFRGDEEAINFIYCFTRKPQEEYHEMGFTGFKTTRTGYSGFYGVPNSVGSSNSNG